MEKPSSKLLATTGLALQLGFTISIPLVLFILLGLWADKRWGTLPLFTILGVILSLIFTVYEMMRIIKSTQSKNKE